MFQQKCFFTAFFFLCVCVCDLGESTKGRRPNQHQAKGARLCVKPSAKPPVPSQRELLHVELQEESRADA